MAKFENNINAIRQLTNDALLTCLSLSFQDLYRYLLDAESKGILDDVDMTQVERLILDPERENKDQDTSLMAAAQKGDIYDMKELIAQGADINAQDQHGETALMAAAKNGLTASIDQLLQSNPQLNITDNELNTALIKAILGRKIECVKKLIFAGTDVNIGIVPPLICSIRSKCFGSVNELLMARADVNHACDFGNTPLIEAVYCGKNTIVQSLLLKGADVNAENTNGNNAIHLAAERSYQEFKRQQLNVETKKENGELTSWPDSAKEFARFVNMRLKGEILSNEVLEGFNPQTIHLDPPEFQKPDFHILKMLLAAGVEMDQTNMFTCAPDLHLKNLVKNYIREHLKRYNQSRTYL